MEHEQTDVVDSKEEGKTTEYAIAGYAIKAEPKAYDNPGHYGNPHASYKEKQRMSENIYDKINVNVGEGRGGGDSGNTAAIIAALGNRNQNDSLVPLLAALGNRNDNRHDDGFGGGTLGGVLGLAVILGMLRGRGGFGGGDDCGDGDSHGRGNLALNTIQLQALNDLRASVPKDVLESQGIIQTNLAQLALGLQQGLGNVKDTTQASTYLLTNQINNVNQNVSDQGCQTREAVLNAKAEILMAIKQNRIDDLEDRVRQIDHHSRIRETEFNITQNVNQQQLQAQAQAQFQGKLDSLCNLANGLMIQNARQNQDIVNLGTMVASGTQAATTTQVR